MWENGSPASYHRPPPGVKAEKPSKRAEMCRDFDDPTGLRSWRASAASGGECGEASAPPRSCRDDAGPREQGAGGGSAERPKLHLPLGAEARPRVRGRVPGVGHELRHALADGGQRGAGGPRRSRPAGARRRRGRRRRSRRRARAARRASARRSRGPGSRAPRRPRRTRGGSRAGRGRACGCRGGSAGAPRSASKRATCLRSAASAAAVPSAGSSTAWRPIPSDLGAVRRACSANGVSTIAVAEVTIPRSCDSRMPRSISGS